MVFSFSGLNTYGKSGVGNVEGAFGSLNITRDPPRSYEVPHRVKVGDTSAVMEEIADSQSRFVESIRKYPRGVNPAVDVSYGNYAETGFQGAQAHPPYKIMNGGAFRPPVLSQQELLPLSRQVRQSTSAMANAQNVDYTLRPITHVNPQNAREITSVLPKHVKAPVYYALERPASAPDVSASSIRSEHERMNISAGSGIRTLDLTKLIVRTPNGNTVGSGPAAIATTARYGSESLRRDKLPSVPAAGTILSSQKRGLPGSVQGRISSSAVDTPHALAGFGGQVRLSEILHQTASSAYGLAHVGSETVVRTPSKNISERYQYPSASRASQASVGSETVWKAPTHSIVREEDLVHVVAPTARGGQSYIGAPTRVRHPSSGVLEDSEYAVARNVMSGKVLSEPVHKRVRFSTEELAATRRSADVLRVAGSTARGLLDGGAGLSSRVHLHSEPYVRGERDVLRVNAGTGIRGDLESNTRNNAYVGGMVRGDEDLRYSAVSSARTLERNFSGGSTVALERNTPLVHSAPNRTSATSITTFPSTEKRLREVITPGAFVPSEGAPTGLTVPDIILKRRGPVSNY